MADAFVASPTQRQFAEAVFSGDYTILGYGGAIRGGKSYGVLAIVVTLCRIFPGSRWAVVRSDLPTIRRNVLPTFEKIRALTSGFVGSVNQGTWSAQCANGSEILFFPESIATDPDLDRWKGLEVNGFVLEEANELAEKSYHKAIERAGSWIIPATADRPAPTQPPPLILCTFNPSATWVRQVFYDPWRNGALVAPRFFQPATVEDNPYLPDAYKQSLKAMPQAEYQRFVQGDWDVLAGRYFDELDRGTHIVPAFGKTFAGDVDIPDWWEQWGALDWGFRHFAVAGAFAKDGDGTTYLVDSAWCQSMTPDEIANRMRSQLPRKALAEVYAGHDCWAKKVSMGGIVPTIAEVMQERDVGLVRAAIDRVPGWQTLRRALSRKQPDGSLGAPALYVCDTPGNRKLFEQLAALEYDETHPEDVSKKKAEMALGDDGCDMLRYGMATRYQPATEPVPYKDKWIQGMDPQALVPFVDETPVFGELSWGF